MRGDDHVGIAEQGVAGGRLLAEHVECGAGDLPRVERRLKVLLHEQRPAGDVQDPDAVLHPRERVRVEPVLGLGGLGQVDGDEVGDGVEIVRGRGALDAELAESLLRHVEVEADHAHTEAACALGHELADPAEPEDPERLLVQLHAAEARALPGAAGERGVRLRHVAREGQQQRHRVLGGGDDVRLRRVHHHDPALGRGLDVHVVDPHARAADRAQARGLLDQAGVELGRGADEDRVELSDPCIELAVGPVEAQLDIEPGVAQELDAGLPDLLLYEYARAVGHTGAATGTPASRNTAWAAPTPAPSSTSWPASRSAISKAANVVVMSKAEK